jgi:hypothetical protein
MVNSGKRRLVTLGFLILLLACSGITSTPSLAPAADTTAALFYVDGINGSDSDPGTSREQAWRTIQHAADTMEAGDTVIVLAGDYDERVHVFTSGSSGAPITYWGEGEVTTKGFSVVADHITVKGFQITNTDDDGFDGWGILVKGSHCVIEDNDVFFATRGGIIIQAEPPDAPTTSDCIIRNNRLYRNAVVGLEMRGRNHLVEGNEIWGTIQYHPKWENPPDSVDADGIRFFGSGHTISGNYIHDITFKDPENVDPHIDCFQTWGPAYDIVFERNLCEVLEYQDTVEYGKGFMVEELNPPVRDLVVRNNIIHAFNYLTVKDCENAIILNNTFSSDLSFTYVDVTGLALRNSPNATIKNNIFRDNQYYHLFVHESSQQGTEVEYNNVYRSDGQPPLGSPSPYDLWDVNPMFVNAAANDFHLQSNSPCIDAGDEVDVAEDFEGNSRPQGAGYDIGAFEYTANGPPPNELIIDDADPGFSVSSSQDAWQEYVEPDGQHYGDTHYYNPQSGTGDDVATWSFRVPQPGQYEVHAWWYEGSSRPTDVPYTVNRLFGSNVVRVNQQINGGTWNLLGSFEFLNEGAVSVSDDVSSGQDIVADAIRLVFVGPLPPGRVESSYLPLIAR